MNLYVLCVVSFFLIVSQTEIAHSRSILGAAISTRGDKISLDSTDTNITKPETKAISSESIIRKGSKQDDDDTISTGTKVGTPIQTVVNAILVPGVEYAAASILKAVSSPFEFITKSVRDYVNPSTSTVKPAKVVQNNAEVADNSQGIPQTQSRVTYLVIAPDQVAGTGSVSSQKAASHAPVAPARTKAPREEDEEDDEEIEDEFFN